MKTPTLLFLAWCLASHAFSEVPAIDGAQVTIPYGELKSLLDAAGRVNEKSEPVKPPVEAVLKAARYQLDLSAEPPSFSVEYEARTLTDSWHAIPLCGGGIRLTGSESSAESSVVRSGEFLMLLIDGTGEHQAKLTFAIEPLANWNREEGLRVSPSPATINELSVTGISEGQTLAIAGLSPAQTEAGALLFHLPGDGKEVHLLPRAAAADDVRPAIPSSWILHSQIVARFADGRLRHTARIQAEAESGSGLSMSLLFPPKAGRIAVEGDDLDQFQILPRQEDGRRVRIDWKTRDNLDRTLLVSWETPQSPLAENWVLAQPVADNPEIADAPENAGESRSLFALIPVDGLELAHPSLRSALESRQLPGWIKDQLAGEESLTAEIIGDSPIDLAATWLPRLETAQATISLASFESRLVADGSILVTADYRIQHGAPINWQLELPSADQVLTCEVNQLAAKPIQRDDNTIEFRLSAPTEHREKDEGENFLGSRIRLCYALALDPLDPVSGRVAIELPQTDLFIHRLDWSLAIPDRYQPTAIEGNVELAARTANLPGLESDNLIRLTKELCRDERPAVEIFYQRRELTTDS